MDWGSIFTNTLSAVVGWEVVAYALAAIGLNIHFGYTGLLNFGQAGFMAVGAYGVAMGVSTFGLGLGAAFLFAILFTVVLALLLGVPTLRLRADYLAIVTLAAAEILKLFFRSASLSEYTGGSDGLQGSPPFVRDFRALSPFQQNNYDFGLFTVSGNILWVITAGWTMVALATLLVWLMMRSPWGRVLKGIREDEDAVRSLGKNVYSYKMQSLVLGGAIGAVGGFIGGLGLASVQPDSFNTDFTFIAFTMLILGGAARVLGPVIGAVLFWGMLSFIGGVLTRLASGDNPIIPPDIMNSDQVSNVRFMLVGLALMLLMIFRPQGIFGDRKEVALDAR